MGLPFMGLANFIYDNWGDHPEDLDTMLKRNVFGDEIGRFMQHGVLPGVLAAKLDDSKVFSVLPYTNLDLTSAKGVKEAAAGVMGPAMTQLERMAAGVGLIKQGDVYKGAEKLMPKGLESAMQAYRLANEGMTLKNGDVLVKPSDISDFALVLNSLGIPPDEIRDITQNENVQFKLHQYFTDNTRQLERAYVDAVKEKDVATQVDIRAKWMELQREKDSMRMHYKTVPDILKHQPMATLTGAVQRAVTREQKERKEMVVH
jgi:hypothetical protein